MMKSLKNLREHCCEQMTRNINDKRAQIFYLPHYRSYYIEYIYEPEFRARHVLNYCPWCGVKLPEDLTEKYYVSLEKDCGIDSYEAKDHPENIPDEFKTEAWWLKRGL